MKAQSFKIGDLAQFNILVGESGSAQDKFGVEPENSWYDVEVYVEKLFGEIVSENTVQAIYKDGTRGTKTFKILDGQIDGQSEAFSNAKRKYGRKNAQILDGSDLNTLKDFLKVSKIPLIHLSPTYINMSCLRCPPKVPVPVTVVVGSSVKPKHVYRDGQWRVCKTDTVSTDINETAYWQACLKRVYMNRMILIDQSDFFGNQSPA